MLAYSRSYSWSSNENVTGTENDAYEFGSASDIYGDGGIGSTDPNVWQGRGGQRRCLHPPRRRHFPGRRRSRTISYLETSYAQSYDDYGTTKGLAPGLEVQAMIKGPVAKGWNRSFDGTAINPQILGIGVTQTDVYQAFRTDIWQKWAISRLDEADQRTYTFKEDGNDYSYASPAEDFEGAYNRSYNKTNYAASYDINGRPTVTPPTVTSYSFSKDGMGKFTRTYMDQAYAR